MNATKGMPFRKRITTFTRYWLTAEHLNSHRLRTEPGRAVSSQSDCSKSPVSRTYGGTPRHAGGTPVSRTAAFTRQTLTKS